MGCTACGRGSGPLFALTSSSIPAPLTSAAISPRLTASHPNSEVKRGRVEAVLRWGTTREGSMLYFFFSSLSPLSPLFCSAELVCHLPVCLPSDPPSSPLPSLTRTPFTLSVHSVSRKRGCKGSLLLAKAPGAGTCCHPPPVPLPPRPFHEAWLHLHAAFTTPVRPLVRYGKCGLLSVWFALAYIVPLTSKSPAILGAV